MVMTANSMHRSIPNFQTLEYDPNSEYNHNQARNYENVDSDTKKKFVIECDCKNIFRKICIPLTLVLIIAGIILTILAFIAAYNKNLLVPSTTVSPANNSKLVVGQTCQYSNQCQEKAFCNGTCQCPVHYYQITIGNCTLRKTYAAACSKDYECNHNVGLKCLTGTCQCDSPRFWNSTYVVGTGIPNGRCQNRKVYGATCTGSDCINGASCSSSYNAQSPR